LEKPFRLLVLLLLLAAPTASHAQQGTVTGRVVGQPAGGPISGAVVTIPEAEAQATTSQDGQFRLESVPAGTRVVKAQREGYRPQGRAVSVPIGRTAEVQLKLQPKSSSAGPGESSNQEKPEQGEESEQGKRSQQDDIGRQDDASRASSCETVTVPENWLTTDEGAGEGRVQTFRGRSYRVRTYLAPALLSESETLTNDNSTLVRIPTRLPGSSRSDRGSPISSRAELIAVMSHLMNTAPPRERWARYLSVDASVDWEGRADDWRSARQSAFDPQDGKIASALLLGGKLLGSVGISMAIGDLSGLSGTAGAAAGFAIDLGSATLDYFESVTATPKDKSLAPAMRALADLDAEHQSVSYQKTLEEVQGSREYLNRYMDVSSEAAEVAGSFKFAAEEWSKVSTAIENARAAQDPIIANTPAGTQALTNAHDYFSAAAMGAAEEVTKELLFWEIEELSSGVNRYLFTANFYLTVLEAYARLLDERKQKLARPESFGSWSAYSEALSRYQYRVALYHEVRLGLMTNLYQYSNRLDDMGLGKGEAAIPDETIEKYRELMNEQRKTYEAIREEISTQMQVLDAMEARYPDFVGGECQLDTPPGDDPTLSNITLETQGQKVVARSDEGVEWRYTTERPSPAVSKRKGGVAYVVDGKQYRAEASHVYALKVTTGNLLWEKEIGNYTPARVFRVRDGTLVVKHVSGIYALDAANGETLWAFEEFRNGASTLTVAEELFLFLDGAAVSTHMATGSATTSTLYALDQKTGEVQWSKTLLSEPRTSPLRYVSYDVKEDVVIARNTRTGQTYRLALKTGEKTGKGGPSSADTVEKSDTGLPRFVTGKVVNVNDPPFREAKSPYKRENIYSYKNIKLELMEGEEKRLNLELSGKNIELIFEPLGTGNSGSFWTIMKADVEGYSTFRLYGKAPHGPGANQLALREVGKVYDYSELIEPNVLLLLKPTEFYGNDSDPRGGGMFKIFVATHR
jgi:hypothetical protein